ncbi:hypothetical protein AMATHDRAFT_73847 [Amanita thiersii Skay4041]|uniref:HSP90-domain-containing protein n=1 Tax=Amanita thiersii Skay4041 TaxID=703135 RepID=A0A2A9NXV3_9AGAR|nr:hypothetical protein AMATHDRAFT_73847 [Amanita thiersii Skay4041]
MSLPPLPHAWSQHIGPGGQPYYYNQQTNQSTYIRPIPAFPLVSHVPPKKEKPLFKTPIPGTEWVRIRTTENNIFYTHKSKKHSVWIVPDEIKDAVEALEQQEKNKPDRPSHDIEQEVERVKGEVQELVKRKATEPIPVDEVIITKKPRTEDTQSDDQSDETTTDDEEEEDWQREAALQLAAEAEEQKKRAEEEENQRIAEEAEAHDSHSQQNASVQQGGQSPMKINIPDRVDLSIDEAKALFKTLLREKDINPLHPWDKSLPLFVSDPRYILLPSVTARRDAFDEYCRERAREIKQFTIKKETVSTNSKEEFEKLLNEVVKSTRTTWSDFRRTWKKDRRFYGWGRDDREREKRFREYMKQLSEKKRVAAEKAETDFLALLKESVTPRSDLAWKDVKRNLYEDPRYDAVGSSSLREELYNTFLIGTASSAPVSTPVSPEKGTSGNNVERDDKDEVRKRKERKERAMKEREEKVRMERNRLDVQIERSRQGINKEEGELQFRTLLTDAIRDPQTSWDAALPQLKTDPRFVNSTLPRNQQMKMFYSHVDHLREKHFKSLHTLFESHAPSLAIHFTELPVSSLLSALPITKLGYDVTQLEHEYEKWQRDRFHQSRKAFDEMLSENSFVEFWGRLSKIGGEGVDGGVKADDLGEDEGEGGGGKVDMKALARDVNINDIEKVLKNDKRYINFDHIPEQREKWIRVCMRLLRPLLFTFFVLSTGGLAQDGTTNVKHDYQSDVARMRKIVINREIFLRELISNANDALEKLRLVSLTNKSAWNGVDPLNITINAIKDEDGKGGRIIISDTGIGMSPEELKTNLGTLAKSGTSDFLTQVENQDGASTSNLIGAFGLGFYSSFLVADRVDVASVPPSTEKVPNPVQHVFHSGAEESTFEVYPDPRGNTLGRGTEITLHLKEDALEYLEESNIQDLVDKHSSYSSSFPIYLFTRKTIEVPDEEEQAETADADTTSSVDEPTETPEVSERDEEEAIVEDVSNEEEKSEDKTEEEPPKKMKSVQVEEWVRLNSQPPLWTRDPKNVTDEEYKTFYKSFFKDYTEPLAWHHFAGDSESGVSFKAIVFLPSKIDDTYWQQPLLFKSNDVKLMVKRVFITSDFGEDSLPKWASWVKVVVDAEDLPLNVSRETLQSSRFLKQMRTIILRRLIQLYSKISEEDAEKFEKVQEVYGSVFKLGAVEDAKNRDKLMDLIRFTTNQRNSTSLDEYLANRKTGQLQIFYLADMGKSPEDLAQSVFVEKLHARGYEVLLLTEPLDEILLGTIRQWKNVRFQDAAKAGLKFGDESTDPEEEKAQKKALTETYKPLIDWLKVQAGELVKDVVISNRLVRSPCAIVADTFGYTANVQRMMRNKGGALHEFAMKAKVLEVNPRSPLIEGLLRRIELLPTDPEQRDADEEEELKEVVSILIDSALIRSGFEVKNTNEFFSRMDRVLRRSLGVSETAPTDETVKPAPPVAPDLPSEQEFMDDALSDLDDEEDDGQPRVILPDHMKDDVKIELEEIDDDEDIEMPAHDEL